MVYQGDAAGSDESSNLEADLGSERIVSFKDPTNEQVMLAGKLAGGDSIRIDVLNGAYGVLAKRVEHGLERLPFETFTEIYFLGFRVWGNKGRYYDGLYESLLVGASSAGKTQALKSLVHALGGSFSEETVGNQKVLEIFGNSYDKGENEVPDDRTVLDGGIIILYDTLVNKICRYNLGSHAGHDITYSFDSGALTLDSKNTGLILIIDPTKDANQQIQDTIDPIVAGMKDNNEYGSFTINSVLITKQGKVSEEVLREMGGYVKSVNDGTEVPIFYADNPNPNIDIDELAPQTLFAVMQGLPLHLKAIYFGHKEIPAGLRQRVISLDDTVFRK